MARAFYDPSYVFKVLQAAGGMRSATDGLGPSSGIEGAGTSVNNAPAPASIVPNRSALQVSQPLDEEGEARQNTSRRQIEKTRQRRN
jgi:hypothetical protein